MKTTWIRNGNRFTVKQNGLTGEILKEDISIHEGKMKKSYTVRWDGIDGEHTYIKHSDLEVISKELEELKSLYGIDTDDRPITLSSGEVKLACDHVWKNYNGFNDAFDFCEKCDEKAPYMSGGKT